MVPVSLPRLVSTAAGAVNSKGRENNFFSFFFMCEYGAVLKGYPKPLPTGYSALKVVIFGFICVHSHEHKSQVSS